MRGQSFRCGFRYAPYLDLRCLAVCGACAAISFGVHLPHSFCHSVENQFTSMSGFGHPHSPTESSSSSSGDCRKVNELKVLLLRPAIRTNSFAFRNKNKNKGRAQKLITISTGTLISRRCGPEKITHSCLFRLAACHLICISVILILHFFLRRFFI